MRYERGSGLLIGIGFLVLAAAVVAVFFACRPVASERKAADGGEPLARRIGLVEDVQATLDEEFKEYTERLDVVQRMVSGDGAGLPAVRSLKALVVAQQGRIEQLESEVSGLGKPMGRLREELDALAVRAKEIAATARGRATKADITAAVAQLEERLAELGSREKPSDAPSIDDVLRAVNSQSLAALPVGTILPWAPPRGAAWKSAIPDGWALCDGSGRTPDLRGRFLMGAPSPSRVGERGGRDDIPRDTHQHHGSPSEHSQPGTTEVSPKILASKWRIPLSSHSHDHGGENRPRFHAVLYIMRVQ